MPSDLVQKLRLRAQVAFDANKAAGRKGKQWAVGTETYWQAANRIEELERKLYTLFKAK